MPEPDIKTPEDTIVDALVACGYAVVPDYIPSEQIVQMRSELERLRASGQMRRAGIGKAAEVSVSDHTRGDFIYWLDDGAPIDAARSYLDRLEALRLSVNQSLALGLFEFEGHYALYPPGAFYRKHLDQFHSDTRRTLTTILYLNENWQESDGGQLRIYPDGNEMERHLDISPVGGTFVTFLSARLWHEVLPATRDRSSITGWFKTRT